ncbi:MAG: alpha/beta hydrolase [Alphaproteobacteria bacterium]|nr:alpha/beta hydrolase [Alphaproteobacteria bacterium]
MPQAYYARLKGDHGPDVRIEAARRFMVWDLMLMQHPGGTPEEIENNKAIQILINEASANPARNLALATLFFHYYVNEYAPDGPGDHLKAMADNITIPVHIIQGADDLITPARFARQLHNILPQSDLTLLENQGHSKAASGMYQAIAAVTDMIADGLRPALQSIFTAADPLSPPLPNSMADIVDPAFITPSNGAPGMPEV